VPDYYNQYSGAAAGYAAQYNIPPPIFFGLIQQESSWNPFADAPNSSAYGFTQLLSGTANDLGVNVSNPLDQLKGGAEYLASMPGSTWTEKLAHYYQGPGAAINSSGLAYAQSVLEKAKSFLNGGTLSDVANGGACAAGDPMACLSLANGAGGDCGMFDFVCKLQKWVSQSNFFTRLALAALALLLVLGGLYLMKERN
jgi:hypothetical protein